MYFSKCLVEIDARWSSIDFLFGPIHDSLNDS